MWLAVSEWIGLVLIIGLIVSGVYLVHSMTVTRSLVRVRVAAIVSLVFMIAFMAYTYSGA